MAFSPCERVTVGRIAGLYGVRGFVRVYSYTHPRDNILDYSCWYLRLGNEWHAAKLVEGQPHGKGIVARLSQCRERDTAARLLGAQVAIRREALPETAPGEYYWADLKDLRVENLSGAKLGVVDHLIETGANDVLVVRGERERLIPFVYRQVVRAVDVAAGTLTVDWEADF
jgi:16S rRNA processing protein RimM